MRLSETKKNHQNSHRNTVLNIIYLRRPAVRTVSIVEAAHVVVAPLGLTSTASRQTLRSRSYLAHSASETIGLVTAGAAKSYASNKEVKYDNQTESYKTYLQHQIHLLVDVYELEQSLQLPYSW